MSFATKLSTLLQADSAINSLVENRIFSFDYPDNLNITYSAIVFTYQRTGGTSVLEEANILEEYTVYIVILAPDTVEVDNISEVVKAYLKDYEDSNFLDIVFNGDTNGKEDDKERFFKALEYLITYKN